MHAVQEKYFENKWVIGLIAAGIILRLKLFFDNRSLWMDEACAALDIVAKGLKEIVSGVSLFPTQPQAPMGFSIISKINTILFGDIEFVLRIFPFVAGILSLFLFYFLLRQWTDFRTKIIAMSFLAFCPMASYYSSEFKPYSSDIFFTLVIYLISSPFFRSDERARPNIILWIAMSVFIWISYASLFVLSGVGSTLILTMVLKKQWSKYRKICLFSFAWLLSFLVLYNVSLDKMGHNQYLIETWKDAFLPRGLGVWMSFVWFKDRFVNMLGQVMGLSVVPLGAIMFFWGGVSLLKREKQKFYLLITPLLFVLLAAVLGKYPFRGRMILFLVPAVSILIAEGIVSLSSIFKRQHTLTIFVLTAMLLINSFRTAINSILQKQEKNEIRPLVRYLQRNYKKGDILFMNNSAQYAYGYYHGLYSFHDQTTLVGRLTQLVNQDLDLVGIKLAYKYFVFTDAGYLKHFKVSNPPYKRLKRDFLTFHKNKRSWFVISHFGKDSEAFLLDYVDRNHGKRLSEKHVKGSSLYLYDLSQSTLFKDNFIEGVTIWE